MSLSVAGNEPCRSFWRWMAMTVRTPIVFWVWLWYLIAALSRAGRRMLIRSRPTLLSESFCCS